MNFLVGRLVLSRLISSIPVYESVMIAFTSSIYHLNQTISWWLSLFDLVHLVRAHVRI